MIDESTINKMTLEEKIQVMEIIWEDLAKTADALSSPDWHTNILDEREDDIKSGKAELMDWEITKKKISKVALNYINENKYPAIKVNALPMTIETIDVTYMIFMLFNISSLPGSLPEVHINGLFTIWPK